MQTALAFHPALSSGDHRPQVDQQNGRRLTRALLTSTAHAEPKALWSVVSDTDLVGGFSRGALFTWDAIKRMLAAGSLTFGTIIKRNEQYYTCAGHFLSKIAAPAAKAWSALSAPAMRQNWRCAWTAQ